MLGDMNLEHVEIVETEIDTLGILSCLPFFILGIFG